MHCPTWEKGEIIYALHRSIQRTHHVHISRFLQSLIQRENDIFPVEVKSETNIMKLDDDVLNIPLFMADHADRLIGLALEQKNTSMQYFRAFPPINIYVIFTFP